MREKIRLNAELKEIVALYVEDEDIIRDSLSNLISRHVKELHLAKNGEEGLNLYKELKPDIVITDIQMPLKNGLDMAKEIKEINRDARIILTTAFGDSEYLLAAIDIEINGYMIKPINRNKLFSLLNDNAKYVLHEKQKARFQAYAQQIIDFQSNMITVLDSTLQMVKCNKSFLDYFGVNSNEEFIQKYQNLNDAIIKTKKRNYISDINLETLEEIQNNPTKKHIVIFQGCDKSLRSFVLHANRLINEKNMTEYIISLTDVTVLEDENANLEQKAIIDRLTGIYNRHKFDEVLDREIEKTKVSNDRFGIVFFDIDHFKITNDTYGHDVGDDVLKAFANIVKKDLRSSDTFARWGGEEFAVLMPNATIDSTKKFAERLRRDIEAYDFSVVGKITSSFGVAIYKESESREEFLKRVDNALYKAKNSGRNRVEIDD